MGKRAHNGHMKRGAKLAIVHGAVGAAVLLVLALFWLRGDDATAPEPVPAVPAEGDEPPAQTALPEPPLTPSAPQPGTDPPAAADSEDEAAPPPPLPPLDASDAFVRAWFSGRATEVWDVWLVNTDLVRLATVVLEYAARGLVPRRSLSFITVERFKVREEGERILIHPDSFARYDALVDAALALPPEDAAAFFLRIEPLIAEALTELGVQDPSPRTLLNRAIDQVLTTPVPSEPVALVRPGVHYEFADPALEARSALQKQLLRTGPANVSRIHAWAERLRGALARR